MRIASRIGSVVIAALIALPAYCQLNDGGSPANGAYDLQFSVHDQLAGGSVVAGPNSNQCTENLTGVSNAQYINVGLNNVGGVGNVSVQMGILTGDTNADKFTDAIDTAQTKSQSGHAITNSNFRTDVNVDGFIDAIDTALVKSKSGTALPNQ